MRRFSAGLAGLAMTGVLVVAGQNEGNPADAVRLLSGAVWLSSGNVGQLTLLDGSAEEVAAQVQVASQREQVDAVQEGTTGYAVNRSAGWIRRVDGATFALSPPASPITGADDGLRLLTSPNALYALDIEHGALTRTDPATLVSQGGVQPLAAEIGPQAATVDGTGRLWVLDTATGDLSWTQGGQRGIRRKATESRSAMLVTANGSPVLVDPQARTATTLDPVSGEAVDTLHLDLRPEDKVQVSGSPHSSRLYVVASRGVLEVCDFGADQCDAAVPLNGSGDFGAAVETAGRLFVPDYVTGSVWIIDLQQKRVVARAEVMSTPRRFQLLTRDGIVFFNDPDSEQAGVVRLDGGTGKIAKYDPADPSKGLSGQAAKPASPAAPDSPSSPSSPSGPAPDKPVVPADPASPVGPPPSVPDQPVNQPVDRPGDDPVAGRTPAVRIVVSSAQPQVGANVTLKAAATFGPEPVSAHWTFGDGAESADVMTSHQWATAQTYQIAVQATFADGQTAVASMPLQITAAPQGKPKLTVTAPANGSIHGPGINCPATCTNTFDLHGHVALTAQPKPGFEFVNWGGACLGTDPTSCQLTMDADKTVSATFQAIAPPAASATATVNPANHSGACGPGIKFTFSGTISVTKGPVDVTYKWIRSDGAVAPTETLHFAGAGAQKKAVSTTWTISAGYTGWQAIQILTPNAAQSNHADFKLTCTGPAASATASVTPKNQTIACQPNGFKFTFTGTISVTSGPVDVTYKWIRSDGAVAQAETLHFAGAGAQQKTVSTTWSLWGTYSGWQAVEVSAPGHVVSNHASFSLTCTD
ncbi:MAG: PKD domain-containing protein [Kibdelosporangium sp.]